MSDGGADAGVKGYQAVVASGRIGCGGDADGDSGGGTDRGWGGDGQSGDGDRLSQWEDNVDRLTLGTEPNSTLAYALVLEHHYPIMSTLGDSGGWLDIYIYISLVKKLMMTGHQWYKTF